MAPRTFETLRDQAAMQVAARSERARWKVLAPEPARGFELLPPPSGGDLFFDIEGDPFWEPGARARVPLGDRRHRRARSGRSGRTTARRSAGRSRA